VSKTEDLTEIKRIVEENNKILKEIVERFFSEKPHKVFLTGNHKTVFQKKSHNEGFKEE